MARLKINQTKISSFVEMLSKETLETIFKDVQYSCMRVLKDNWTQLIEWQIVLFD